MWPIYYKDKLKVGNIKSNVAIVTLWTPVQTISAKLDENKYLSLIHISEPTRPY